MKTTLIITLFLQTGISVFYGISMIGCLHFFFEETGVYRNFKKAISPKGIDFANNFQKARVMIGATERQLFLEKKPNGISLLQFIVVSDIKFGFIKGNGIIDGKPQSLMNEQVFMAKISFPNEEEKSSFYKASNFKKIEPLPGNKFIFSAQRFLESPKMQKTISFRMPIPCIN